MGRRGAVLEFRRPRPRKVIAPGPVRTNKLRLSKRRKSSQIYRVPLGFRVWMLITGLGPPVVLGIAWLFGWRTDWL